MSASVSRRGFLIGLAAGVGLGLSIRPEVAHAAADTAFTPNLWVRLLPDGTLFVTCHRSEMGQGVRATLPWIIAAEMGADFDRVVIEQAPGDKAYGNQNTDGSTSVREQWPMLREVGATARVMLIAAAAEAWGVSPDGLVAEDHAVSDPASGEALGFGELAERAAAMDVPREVPLRPELVLFDEDLPFRDARAIVDGSAVYGADMQLEGLLTAVVARPPDLGGRVASFDDSEAREVPGVVDVIELPRWKAPAMFKPVGGVAVVATNTWAAMKGRDALDITWEPGPHAEIDTETEYAAMRAKVDTSGKKRRSKGNADRALEDAAQVHTATYRVPHLVHAPMEPPAAVAWVRDDGCEVWAPVQAPQRTRTHVSKVVGLPKKKVTVNVTLLGGGFGRKGKPDFVSEAAYLSKQVGAPVRVQWDRADDVRHSYYHACAVQRIDAGFDEGGTLTAWRHRVCAPSIASTFLPFLHRLVGMELGMGLMDLAVDAPDLAVEVHPQPEHLRIGWLRSVYNINHAFSTQCFVDELAALHQESPPAMLKRVLGPPRILTNKKAGGKIWNYGLPQEEHPVDVGRWHSVIDEVVAASGYHDGAGDGRAFGFAAHLSFNTYVAVVVAMTRDHRGRPKVNEAWVAVDAGQVMNRDRCIAQMEGAVIFGTSIALYGEVTVADGAVVQSNFHDYRIARMRDAPRAIHVSFVDSGEPPGGIGEPGVPPVAPAIVNGWYALTGERVRTLPLLASTPGRLPAGSGGSGDVRQR